MCNIEKKYNSTGICQQLFKVQFDDIWHVNLSALYKQLKCFGYCEKNLLVWNYKIFEWKGKTTEQIINTTAVKEEKAILRERLIENWCITW